MFRWIVFNIVLKFSHKHVNKVGVWKFCSWRVLIVTLYFHKNKLIDVLFCLCSGTFYVPLVYPSNVIPIGDFPIFSSSDLEMNLIRIFLSSGVFLVKNWNHLISYCLIIKTKDWDHLCQYDFTIGWKKFLPRKIRL